MNTELRKAAKNDFEKDLFKLMNNSVFGKMMENIRKHRDIKLVTTDKKRSKLVSEPNYHTINLISLVKFNVIGLMKYELGGKIITEFVTLRPKTNSFLTDDGKEDEKAKGTKKCVIKKMIKFNDYKKCLLNDEVILKSQQRFISKKYDVYTENINKIILSNNDDKRIVSSDTITSYPYGYKGEIA